MPDPFVRHLPGLDVCLSFRFEMCAEDRIDVVFI